MRLDTNTLGPDKTPPLGLALGGGVARGWAHIGALRALIEAGIKPDIIAGTSIGAVVGGAYLAGKLDVLEKWARSLNRRRMMSYMDVRWGGSGFMRGERLARVLNHYLGDTNVEDLDRKFAAVTCDLRTGYEVWLQSGPLVPAVRASYALPGAFEPIKIDGRYMIDADVFVAPRIGHIGMLEFTKAEELIERGYRAMQHEIPLIKSVMEVLSQMPSAANAEKSKH